MSYSEIIKLEEKIVAEFSVAWGLNDKAHRIEHFSEVFQTGMELNKRLNLNQEVKLLLFSSYFHDLFAWSRENHHLLSEEFIRGTCHELVVSNLNHEERLIVAGACRRHRASNKEKFSNFFEEFFNASDRERPKGVEAMLKRALLYREGKMPNSTAEEIRADAVLHLKEKYGSGGYASYPDVYIAAFGSELKKIQQQIEDL